MSILFDRIESWKLAHNTSFYAIEKGAGITIGTIKKWKYSTPSGDKILSVAQFMDVSVDYLLGNTDNAKSHKLTTILSQSTSEDLGKALMTLKELTSNASKIEDHIIALLDANGIYIKPSDYTSESSENRTDTDQDIG